MCGIAGYLSHRSRADATVLEGMLNAIGYRGPDECTGHVSGGAALGCVRLSIVDLAGGTQPAVSQDGRTAVVFNGEIFNYRQLKSDLEGRGIRFSTNSEVETLLHLHAVYGEGMFERLKGQFAIAVWDGRRDCLLLARDRFGIHPLFWHADDGGMTFASEIKALATRPHIPLTVNPRSLVQTFRFWTNVGDTSAFEGIHQVPPGHFLVYAGKETRLRRFWEWPLPGCVEPLRLSSDGEYFEAFAEALDNAIRQQRMADVPVAGYLSGGIDSSTVTAVFQRQLGAVGLRTYSVAFEDAEYDESQAQRAVAEHCGFDHSTLEVASPDIAENFRDIVWHAETPLYRAAAVPLFLLSRRVREDGIKVVLTGEGADEVLLGYDLFRETAIRRFWGRRPQSRWRGHLFQRLYHYLPQFQDPRHLNALLGFYGSTLADGGDPHYPMAVRWSAGKALEPYFAPGMRAFAAGYDPVEDLERWLPGGYMDADDIAKAQCIEVSTLLGNYLLSSQGDRMSLAHSVETRYPYLDDDFIAFCARLPRNVKLRGLRDKFVLRNAFPGILPEKVQARPKVAYGAPDIKGFVADGKLDGYAEELLSPSAISEAGFFEVGQVGNLRKRATGTHISRINYRDNMAFVLILSTMVLHQLFVKGRQSPTPAIRRSIRLHGF